MAGGSASGRHRRRPAVDRISDLTDELLQDILLRLRSPHAAARTSVLSRRWTRVWAGLPVLDLEGDYDQPQDKFMDSVDATLAAFSAPAVRRLEISAPGSDPGVPAALRVAPWLRFASQRLAGTLYVFVHHPLRAERHEQDIELPACDGVTGITLRLPRHWRLRIQPASSFAALSDLEITIRMEAREVEDLVSSQCPRLRNLTLRFSFGAASDVSIRSSSLFSLRYHVTNTRLIQVVAPELEILAVPYPEEAHISAPKLTELAVSGHSSQYQFSETRRYLRLLDVKNISASLMQRFDKVHTLKLGVIIHQGKNEYESFVNDTNELPMCDVLEVKWNCSKRRCHSFAPSMFHILRRCNGIRRFTVKYFCYGTSASSSMMCSSPCRLPESCYSDVITLELLEEVEIDFMDGSLEEIELFVKQLSRCNADALKKVSINYRSRHATFVTELRAKVCSLYPNLNVEFIAF